MSVYRVLSQVSLFLAAFCMAAVLLVDDQGDWLVTRNYVAVAGVSLAAFGFGFRRQADFAEKADF